MTEQKARGAGRPPKLAHEKRGIVLATRLTQAEAEATDRLVEAENREAARFGLELDGSAVLRMAVRDRARARGIPWPGDESAAASIVGATVIDADGAHPMAPAKPAADPRQIPIPGTEQGEAPKPAKPRKTKASIPDAPDRDAVRRQIRAAVEHGISAVLIAEACDIKPGSVRTFKGDGPMGNPSIVKIARYLDGRGFAYEPT